MIRSQATANPNCSLSDLESLATKDDAPTRAGFAERALQADSA